MNSASGLEIVFRPDPAIGDGAFSNNAWLQELPKPQNKMTWDNAVWISPESARTLPGGDRRRGGDIGERPQNPGRGVGVARARR